MMDEIWATSCLDADLTSRKAAFAKMQGYADACSSSTFSYYLTGSETLASALEKSEEVIGCYNKAFEKVLKEIQDVKPADGEVAMWLLYNMGYIVKTSSGAFGIDIFHRRAAEFAPYLDFYAMTHVHNDHKSVALADAMVVAGKPVLSNFYEGGSANREYFSETDKDFTIGSFAIHSFITNHNNSETGNVPVTVFRIDCGSKADNCIIIHSGDSNFRPEQFESVKGAKVDVYILRYAPNALTENNVVGSVFAPKYCLISHILELTHTDPANSRWTLEQGLDRALHLNCSNSIMPFWGEKIVWRNGKLNK
ncbi:MAG: hypothetical protein ACI3Y0_05790 [Prevotella sp.]